jgi:spoIIIJ-associated protein
VPQKGSSQVETEEIPIGEQADAADEFVRGLLDAASIPAQVAVRIEDDAVLVDVEGNDLGVLVGPKGATLRAIEDLVRTIVQRRTDGHGARIHVDIGGYQAKRRSALEQFTRDLAGRVQASGNEVALEPMPAADRKVVHDTVATIDGVTTASEGEEPRRRVVIRPV